MDDRSGGFAYGAAMRPYGFWGLCLSLVIIGAATLLVYLGAEAALGFAMGLVPPLGRAGAAVLAALDGRRDLVVTAFLEVTLVLLLLAAARWRGGRGWRYYAIALGTIVYGLAASVAVGSFYPQSHDWDRMPEHPLPTAVFLVLAILTAPVAEELLFRGWIFTALRARRSAWAAIVLSAAAFAAAHNEASHLYALAVFPVGLALGYVRERSGSVKATMLVHAGYNLVLTGLSLLGGYLIG